MLAIHYRRAGERADQLITAQPQIAIGRDPGNDLVLADPAISPRHCRVVVEDAGWTIEDLGSERGTFVNGRSIKRGAVGRGDRVHVGGFVFWLRAFDERSHAVELNLLAAIAQRDPNARLVYADWLEERGDVERAEYVRLQELIADPPMATSEQRIAFMRTTKRLRDLASTLDVDWRTHVARPQVMGCRPAGRPAGEPLAGDGPCRMDWGQLEPTNHPQVRTCTACRKPVQYCLSEADATELAARGHCVAIDLAPFGDCCAQCGRENPPYSQVCLGCGQPLIAVSTMPPMLGSLISR